MVNFFETDATRFVVKNELQETIVFFEYVPDKYAVIDTWLGFVSSEDLLIIYKYISKYLYQNKLKVIKSLTDLSGLGGSFVGVLEWLENNFIPQAVAYGFRYTILIIPKDFFARLALDEYKEMRKEDSGHKIKYFENRTDAVEWFEKIVE